jgi:hypothetical protein
LQILASFLSSNCQDKKTSWQDFHIKIANIQGAFLPRLSQEIAKMLPSQNHPVPQNYDAPKLGWKMY